ncbi:hypothetical protein PAAG_00207 [Paracoccidioides lutzii Pb01]|uniref:Uncharacterized protein n=1 Tax=Paracoccidioides lutzii (strain ATCC MYA-826 / Pb01) TaxID=502779 RepID=C1GNW2_PARBA|nr:hypothetical protein PAAG_00207 [Paracoccidioides lutzii Pb01]EEH35884.2 hypothetical protein PAAG_00207 [Paracoccidioides lutzii Pb01]
MALYSELREGHIWLAVSKWVEGEWWYGKQRALFGASTLGAWRGSSAAEGQRAWRVAVSEPKAAVVDMRPFRLHRLKRLK